MLNYKLETMILQKYNNFRVGDVIKMNVPRQSNTQLIITVLSTV